MTPHDHMAMMTAYAAWANTRLYLAASRVPETEYKADAGVAFGSLEGTLNHILAADQIWRVRLTGKGEAPTTLDAILHDNIRGLRAARKLEDMRLSRYVMRLTNEELAGPVTYRRVSQPDGAITQSVHAVLTHVFNHQTHHRGQAHALLTQMGQPSVGLDLITFQRETA